MHPTHLELLTRIFRDVFKDSTLILLPEMTSNNVDNWDSLSHLTLISTIEKEFGISFKLKELIQLKSVGDLMHIISVKTASM